MVMAASLKIVLVFTTTFHPTEPYGVHGNSGDKRPKDDGFSEQKPLYVVQMIRNQLYLAVRDEGAAGSNPVTSTIKKADIFVSVFLIFNQQKSYRIRRRA